jgi:3-carboxy-cis,cis-muconate cycloisomerase
LSADDLFGPMTGTAAMREVFSGRSWLQAMLDVEAALAAAEEQAGVIPAGTAAALRQFCDASLFSVEELGLATAAAANPGGPVAAALADAAGPALADYVHLGATSQDIVDTAMMRLAGRGLALVLDDLERASSAAAQLADRHRDTVTASRTLLQQGVPITFGLKAAGWLSAMLHAGTALRAAEDAARVSQLGGASGCLATLGADAPRVAALFARELGLGVPPIAWHTDRTPVVQVASALGTAAGVAASIALDIALLAQTEVREVSLAQPAGQGRSSAMPNKRNPVDSVIAIAAARRAHALLPVLFGSLLQEHERSIGGWQAEWPALSELFALASAAVAATARLLESLEVDPVRVRANIDEGTLAEQVTAALARSGLGTRAARALVEKALSSGAPFREALEGAGAGKYLGSAALAAALDLAAVVPAASAAIDGVLAAHRSARRAS